MDGVTRGADKESGSNGSSYTGSAIGTVVVGKTLRTNYEIPTEGKKRTWTTQSPMKRIRF